MNTNINNIEKPNSQVSVRAENKSTQNKTNEQKDDDIPSFGEVWAEKEFEDTELLTDYRNREIIVRSFEVGEGGYGPYVILDVSVNGGTKRLRTSSLVVIDQLNKIKERLPIKAKVVEKSGTNGRKYISLA